MADKNDKTRRLIVTDIERQWLSRVLEINFQGPSADDLKALLPSLTRESFAKGEAIVQEGSDGTDVFFLHKGLALVTKKKFIGARNVVKLKPGEVFGEVGSLVHAERSASVVADDAVEVLRVPCKEFQALLEKHPQLEAYFQTVARQRMQELAGG